MWLGHLPNPTTFVLTNPEYFSLIYASYQKLFNFYIQTNTHTQTHILHPNMHGQDFFCIEIYTFLYTTFVCLLRSLTSFVKDKRKKYLSWIQTRVQTFFKCRTRIDQISNWPNGFPSTWMYLFKHTKCTPFVKTMQIGQHAIRSIIFWNLVSFHKQQ